MANRSRARGPISRHAAGTTRDVSRANAASVNNATAHHRCLRHSTAPHTARAKASASARLARALMISAGLRPTLMPIHHGAEIRRREPRHRDPADPMAARLTASMAQTVASPAGNGDTNAGNSTRARAILQAIDVTVRILHVREGPRDHVELLAVMAVAGDEHGIGHVLLDEAARRAAITDAQQCGGIAVVRPRAASPSGWRR